VTPIKRIAFIGNSLPRRCGIATFTTDLQQAIAAAPQSIVTSIVAMTDRDARYAYPQAVGFEVKDDNPADYIAAAHYINDGGFEAVSLQHEFGIFGGDAGELVLALLERIRVPIVTTLHTIIAEPDAAQRRVLDRIVSLSSRVITMSAMGRDLLQSNYGVDAGRVTVIPHGIPDFDFVEPDEAKARLGFADRTVILTFGLLSPNKGIEVMRCHAGCAIRATGCCVCRPGRNTSKPRPQRGRSLSHATRREGLRPGHSRPRGFPRPVCRPDHSARTHCDV